MVMPLWPAQRREYRMPEQPPSFITKWGSRGTEDGQFTHPQGAALDSSGNVYVADGSNNRIQKFG
jgi:DNA-binding beta-propeller fold protein YncE